MRLILRAPVFVARWLLVGIAVLVWIGLVPLVDAVLAGVRWLRQVRSRSRRTQVPVERDAQSLAAVRTEVLAAEDSPGEREIG